MNPQYPSRTWAPAPGQVGQAPVGVIHIRTSRRRKSAYVRAAKPGKLVPWMLAHLDAAAEFNENTTDIPDDGHTRKDSPGGL